MIETTWQVRVHTTYHGKSTIFYIETEYNNIDAATTAAKNMKMYNAHTHTVDVCEVTRKVIDTIVL